MVARPAHRGAELAEGGLDALAEAAVALGSAASLPEALQAVADAAARAARAEVVVARVADDSHGGRLNACAVATGSPAVAAELEGSWLSLDDLPETEETDPDRLPEGVRRAADRVHASEILLVPVQVDGRARGSLELMRSCVPFGDAERRVARLSAAQAALAIRAFGVKPTTSRGLEADAALTVAGEALAAGADGSRTADQVARLATQATGAVCGLLWEREPERPLRLAASFRLGEVDASLVNASEAAEQALRGRDAVAVEEVAGLPGGASVTATLQLGQPPVGALQLLFKAGQFPTEPDLGVLATFGVRASHALRAGQRSRTVALELERTRALLAVVGQAISELSLAHTLETAVARVAELLDEERLAVYLL